MTDAAVGSGHSGAAAPGTVPLVVQLPPVVAAGHQAAVAAIRESYAALPPGAPVTPFRSPFQSQGRRVW